MVLSIQSDTITTNADLMTITTQDGVSLEIGTDDTIKSDYVPLRHVKKFFEYHGGGTNCGFTFAWGYINTENEIKIMGGPNTSTRFTELSATNNYGGPGITLSLTGNNTEVPDKLYLTQNQVFVLTTAGNVYASGNNFQGQLSTGNLTVDSNLKKCTVSDIASISVGTEDSVNTYFLDNSGNLWACGSDENGQIGNGATTGDISTAINTIGPDSSNFDTGAVTVTKCVALGGYDGANFLTSAMVLLSNGVVYCVGRGVEGQQGDGSNTNNTVWTAPSFDDQGSIADIKGSGAVGKTGDFAPTTTFYALSTAGKLWAWGSNVYGQVGNASFTSPVNTPYSNVSLTSITKFWTGGNANSVFVKKDGKIYAWGYNVNGQLGVGSTSNVNTITQVNSLNNYDISEIIQCHKNYASSSDISGEHVIAVTSTGELLGAGYNGDGELSFGSTTGDSGNNQTTFVRMKCSFNTGKNTVKPSLSVDNPYIITAHVRTVGGFTMVLSKDGYVYYCGRNMYKLASDSVTSVVSGDSLNTTSIIPLLTLQSQYS